MDDAYSTVALLKHYGWHARDYENKPALARELLQEALKIAQDKLPDYVGLQVQLRRDIAELNHVLGNNEDAIDELSNVGYDFSVGDIYMEQGEFEKAFIVYKRFHETGRFKIHWRLWRCSFLLGRFDDVMSYIEDHSFQSPQRVITQLEVRALAIAVSNVYGGIENNSQWNEFRKRFPKCAGILESNVGNPESVIVLARHWSTLSGSEKLTKRLIGKPQGQTSKSPQNLSLTELETVMQKARNGVWDVPEVTVTTATSILKSLATANAKLDGQTVVNHMAKGLVNSVILENHSSNLGQAIDRKLEEFQAVHGTDLISFYRTRILGGFGFYEGNEVSNSIRAILLSAESDVRQTAGLPQRGEGWLAESEMVRLLAEKFAPHKVVRQYSPDWLQGLRFDAYINDLRLAIEYQGEQHFMPIDLFGGKEGLTQTIARDELKRALSAQNGVKLCYITFEQDIEQETTRLAKEYLV